MLEEQKLVCKRCGFTEFVPADKRKRKDELCVDCRRRPAKTINYGLDKSCKPHQGQFDMNDNPVEWGHLFLPGKRVCGHRDCVELSHIIVG
jgi:hypothetical protein